MHAPISGLLPFLALLPAVAALSWIVLGFLFVVRREWRLPLDPHFHPSVAAVMPAYNEELLIATAIEALLAQDYPSLEIHVISDGSTDRTAAIARRFEPRGVVVHELSANAGKLGALQYTLDRTDTDLFLLVDADTESRPDAVRYVVQQFAEPRVGAVTGHARVGNVTGLLTAIQAMEYSVIVGLAKRAEQFWGGLYTVSGAAACFRTQALREVGGWSVVTVTEDIEVSWRLQRAGWLLAYDPRALFFVQAPARLRALYRQRRRWARGMAEVLRLHWDVVASSRNPAIIPIAAQVLCAGLWMLLTTGLLLYTVIAAMAQALDVGALQAPFGADWHIPLLWSVGLFGLQAFIATIFDGAYIARGWWLFPLFMLFPIYFWIVLYPSFLLGAAHGMVAPGSTRWARTERSPIRERGSGFMSRRAAQGTDLVVKPLEDQDLGVAEQHVGEASAWASIMPASSPAALSDVDARDVQIRDPALDARHQQMVARVVDGADDRRAAPPRSALRPRRSRRRSGSIHSWHLLSSVSAWASTSR